MAENLSKALSQTPYVFVYGTLKSNRGNHHILEECEMIGEGVTIDDNLQLHDCGFPYMIAVEHNGSDVLGEVFEVKDEQVLSNLDLLEGVAYSHYARRVIEVEVDGRVYPCWAYFAHESNRESVMSLPLCPTIGGVYEWT